MAVLTKPQTRQIGRHITRGVTTDWSSTQADAAVQAIEDWFEANRGAISAAINAASSPKVFSAAQKKTLLLEFLLQKVRRER